MLYVSYDKNNSKTLASYGRMIVRNIIYDTMVTFYFSIFLREFVVVEFQFRHWYWNRSFIFLKLLYKRRQKALAHVVFPQTLFTSLIQRRRNTSICSITFHFHSPCYYLIRLYMISLAVIYTYICLACIWYLILIICFDLLLNETDEWLG